MNQGTSALALGLDWLRRQIKCSGGAFVMPRGRRYWPVLAKDAFSKVSVLQH